MEDIATVRRRLLLTVTVTCAVIFVADVIALSVIGELPSEWWWVLAVLVGLLVVPILGFIALAWLLLDRRDA